MAATSTRGESFLRLPHGFLFVGGGTFVVFLLIWTLCSFPTPTIVPSSPFPPSISQPPALLEYGPSRNCDNGGNRDYDPLERTFYDDPNLSYSIEKPINNWDEKRREWLNLHPSFTSGEKMLIVTGSQPPACNSPIGDHLLLRLFKNKVDYSRIHGYDIFYNNALFHPQMTSFWAKLPVVRAAMVAHPEAEWIWWVDSDAVFTDMDFKLPLQRYRNHNLVVNGWAKLVYEEKSWTGLNAGVFLIRNCQWSMDLLAEWSSMGPESPDYKKWGQILRSTFKNKITPESDDQAGLLYLLNQEKEKWGAKVYLEGEFYFSGYWDVLVWSFENITRRYVEMEKEASELRRRHAEKVGEQYSRFREKYLEERVYEIERLRRPFITHFTGCQPCSGNHNQMYSDESCPNGMITALNFADNQILRSYGFIHPTLLDSSLSPLPFDYPASA